MVTRAGRKEVNSFVFEIKKVVIITGERVKVSIFVVPVTTFGKSKIL